MVDEKLLKTELETKMGNFLSGLGFRLEIFRTAKKKLDVYLASDFNVFDLIAPDENRLSDIIADLLDPAGKHGQGNTFLIEFLKIIGCETIDNIDKCKIKREEIAYYLSKPGRRIDITIDFNNFGIGIENKPWAEEQKDQIKDYCRHLESKYKDKFCLIYLSGNGNKPQSIRSGEWQNLEQQGKAKAISYPHKFKEWLESCYKECKSEKIRWFLQDFVNYVERNFRIENEEMGQEGSS
ncbi:MAG TPA: PD-(D/E)XK nuclease family protein [Desulfotomaculum sp.]|nr:PD-(D/E)XK nuclease family protein [Desulfotomaculum sp.]